MARDQDLAASPARFGGRRPAAAILLAGLLATSCGGGGRPWDVLLIVVDTLRADHLELAGYPRPTTPFLSRQARGGVVFSRAQSQAGCTFPSIFSLLTSRYPAHFARGGPWRTLPEAISPLPEILERQGWATAAVSASDVVRDTPSRVNSVGGYGRGFGVFDETCNRREAACLNERALELVDRLPQPLFLYLHYMDPHGPYQPPVDHPRSFAVEEGSLPAWVREGQARVLARHVYDGKAVRLGERELEYLVALYDEEIRYLDAQLEALFGALIERGRLEHTLVILASDHGEAFLEHGEAVHCRNIAYDSVLATPLVLWIPGVAGGVRSQPVQNLDILPTLLDYLEVDPSGLGLEGRSLRPVIERDRPVHRYLFATQGTVRTVRDARYKLLHDLATGRSRLYDLLADPGETRDLAGAEPAESARLLETLLDWVAAMEGGGDESLREAREELRRLKAVGYL